MLKASFFSRRILYKPSLILLFQPMMALQKPFHVPKSSFRTPRLLGVSARLLLKPLSIGHLPAGKPEVPINIGLAGGPSENARFTRAAGQSVSVAVKLPRASGSRRFSNRNWRWRLPITLLRHCGIADVLPAQCLRALQTCLSDHGAPFS